MDGTLDVVHRLSSIQDMLQFAPECHVGEVVDQKDSSEQTSNVNAAFVNCLSTCRRAEAGESVDRCTFSRTYRRSNPDKLIPDFRDEINSDIAISNRTKLRRHTVLAGNMKATIAKMRQARAEIKPKNPGHPHCEIGVPMCVDCQRRNIPGCALPDNSFNRRTGLTLIQHNRLVIEDAPAIEYVGVHPNRCCTATRISTSLPYGTCRLERHHVG